MKTLKYVAAAALAAAALPGTAEAATIVTTGPNATTVTANMDAGANNSFTIGFSDSNLSSPTFSELLTFTTDIAGALNIILSTTATTALNDTDFTNVFLTGTGITGQLALNQISGDPNEVRALNTQVGAGTFTLNIQGTPGTQNGAFGGTVAFQGMAAAVPEPGTWALMLFGFGAMGYSLRRRRTGSAHLLQAA